MRLQVKGIEVVYSDVVLALSDVSLSVEDRQVVVLLGGNGAGKSTTLKSISGVLDSEDGEVTEGSVELDGRRIDRLDPENVARLGICHVLQGHPVFPQLTTDENLLMGAYLRKDRAGIANDLDKVYAYFPKLKELKNRKSGYLSGGEQQMLVVGRAVMARPKILLLDEPSLGLAPMIIEDLFHILGRINREEGTSILVAEQNVAAALSVAHYGYVLQNGKVVAEGTGASLAAGSVQDAYLGAGGKGSAESYYAGMRDA